MVQTIRILLVDNHALFRESLRHLLQAESEFQVVGSCSSIEESLAIIEQEHVDIILLDYDEHGLAFQKRARRLGFKGRILIVTDNVKEQEMICALEYGASGIFLKSGTSLQLLEEIHKVMNGKPSLDPKAMRIVISIATARSSYPEASRDWSAREHAVLEAMLEGRKNREIAEKLKISLSSVKSIIHQLFGKTGVRTRSQLVRVILERGFEIDKSLRH